MLDFGDDEDGCGCVCRFVDDTLRLDASDCPGDGELATESDCRATAVGALRDRDADLVVVRTAGLERRYETAMPLLVAAGRFVARAGFHDEALADRALVDPLDAARLAAGRAGPVATIAAETGFTECASAAEGYETLFRPQVAPAIATERVVARPPPDARLRERSEPFARPSATYRSRNSGRVTARGRCRCRSAARRSNTRARPSPRRAATSLGPSTERTF